MRIPGRRLHATMSQRLFDQRDRGAVLQRMSGVRVPHPVRRDIAGDPRASGDGAHDAKNHA